MTSLVTQTEYTVLCLTFYSLVWQFTNLFRLLHEQQWLLALKIQILQGSVVIQLRCDENKKLSVKEFLKSVHISNKM